MKARIINWLASLYGLKVGDKIHLLHDVREPYIIFTIKSFYVKVGMRNCWIGAKVTDDKERGTPGYVYDAYAVTGLVKIKSLL